MGVLHSPIEIENKSLGATDMIIVSVMNKSTGLYENMMVSNGPRWKKDRCSLYENDLMHVDIMKIGRFNQVTRYSSIEEFEENEINL